MRVSICLALAAALLVACSTGSQTVTVDSGTDVAGTADGGPELLTEDLRGLDLPDVEFDLSPSLPDSVGDAGPLGCEPGEGCFLDKCEANADCLSGWCVDHMGESVCTQSCQDECPPGWSCQQVAGTAPDLVYVCVSDFSNLCRPCADGNDCKSPVGAEDVCVDYGEEGAFCGGACADAGDCPWGFSCQETTTVDGIATTQCVADAGVCPCTAKSVKLSLWTPCALENEWGSCTGKRVCGAEGLTACDAALPSLEVCNGLDDDCDGETDEESCDDENPCTTDVCLGADGCEHEQLTGGECVDGDACTIGDHCEEGACVGTPIECDDENPCTDDSCDGLGGCQFVNNAVDCDDGDPCTVADECADGICGGVAVSCDCQSDADCAPLEDGDLCSGTLVCNTAALPFRCAVDPATVVACPPPEGTNAPCLAAACDPQTAACSLVPAHDGQPCDDGDACTAGDVCGGGECLAGPPLSCGDDNPCTTDSCDPVDGCRFEANSVPCNDGNVCTVGDVCGEGVCQPGPDTLGCDDQNPCTDDACDASSGCQHTPNNGGCDDGNACTLGDYCAQGSCKAGGETPDCDDENPCTDDSCAPLTGCVHKLNTAPCDDGDLCTTSEACHLGECVAKGQLACDDGNPCTDDACSPQVGCQFKANAAACDDSNACTTGDHCAAGVCKAQGALACDDANPCTVDSCDPDSGCVHLPADNACNDGDPCTVDDQCVAGACTGSGTLACDDANACTQDSCVPFAGCLHEALDGTSCDDGDPCTPDDVCAAGTCEPAGELACDDGNACTEESCVPFVGCQMQNLDGEPCDDGNACTLTDSCQGGVCLGTGTPECDDGNACTDDSCVPPNGCFYAPVIPCCGDGQIDEPEECDDGNTDPGDGCNALCEEEQAVTMAWTDQNSSTCSGQNFQVFAQIAAAMPDGPLNVTITAHLENPDPGYGDWTGTFANTTCVKQWVTCIAQRDVNAHNHWSPGVCAATDALGDSYTFVCKNDGAGNPQVAVYPTGNEPGEHVKLYFFDRTFAWCDLIGVNSRPGFEKNISNKSQHGWPGDSISFTWWW